MKKKVLFQAPLSMLLLASVLSACAGATPTPQVKPTEAPTQAATEPAAEPTVVAGQEWRNTPAYAPYAETIKLSLVKGGQESAALLPEGESIEDNRALKYIEDTLNIDVSYEWVVPSDSFADKLNLAISSGDIPEAMIVTPIQLAQLVDAGVLEDMTPYVEQYANDDLKENFSQTNGVALEAATIDGKIWGVPNVQPQADAPLMVWARKDWLDKLGLEAPQTLDDVEAVARAFIEQDPDGNGADDSFGLTGTLAPVGVPSNLHGFDLIFNAYGAFPTLFHRNAAGEIVYGSVQPEARAALERLAKMYQDGLIDPDFATKNSDKSNEIVVGGTGGLMIGPWWISWFPLGDSVKNDPNADWQPYLIKDNNGEYNFSMGDYTNSFVVVKKGYSNPEVVVKILNIQNDLSYGYNDAPQNYPNFNEIWTTLFPLPFLIEQPYVVERMGNDYQAALDGTVSPDTFGEGMQVEFAQIQQDMASPRSDSAAWSTRMARLNAALLLAGGYSEVRSDPKAVRFYSVDPNWPSLKKMEDEALLLIITGAEPITYFDTFVEQWNESGGAALLAAMNE